MKILWLTWKDLTHPLAGGAEVVNEELAKRLVADGHDVTFVVGGYKDGIASEMVSGYKIIRLGNRYSLYWLAYRYYRKHFQGWADLVIDEVNTIPFFAKYYVKEKTYLFVHQLARQVWFYQMVFPISLVGFCLEWWYLHLLSDQKVITVSDSTRKDLLRFGFSNSNISIISQGIKLKSLDDRRSVRKYAQPTLLSLGAIRPMKRTHHQIKAFELAKETLPDLRLKVAGNANGRYGQKIIRMIAKSRYAEDIDYLGEVTDGQKIRLMQKCHVIMVTSVKEGWGLIVTEAASQGTPAIVYNIDGLRDSVRSDTGIITGYNTPSALADAVHRLFKDKRNYAKISSSAHKWSRQINFNTSYLQFKQSIDLK